MDWSDFYAKQAGRGVRPTFAAALDEWRLTRGSDAAGDAIDLGCGDGVETRALLGAGWRVCAIDADPHVMERVRTGVPVEERDRLVVRRASFERLAEARRPLPDADLVYAGFALPFCPPEVFSRLWCRIRAALRPGGLVAGELFGPHDDFATWPDVNTHDRAGVELLLDGLEVVRLQEDDRDGRSWAGPKHWHVFHVIARRPEGAE